MILNSYFKNYSSQNYCQLIDKKYLKKNRLLKLTYQLKIALILLINQGNFRLIMYEKYPRKVILARFFKQNNFKITSICLTEKS